MDVTIPGPAGPLEARFERAAAARAVAVLCHPHPLYGGSMFDRVLDVLARRLQDAGVTTLRFNFRGVGASAGDYDGGPGEALDLGAACAWLAAEQPGALWLGGYSFGASVVWNGLESLAPHHVLLVAPPVGAMAFDDRSPPCPVDVFAGDADPFIDHVALARLAGVRAHPIAGADHFFNGRLDQLATAIDAVIRTAIDTQTVG